ncbi:hypothetical protein C4D60_Mb00t13000 [Musa balbisiana]|uniref:Cytochrome c oxidase polypeptide II n=1 Tax=Musa balbisiana TaxID=52838 RepID=A0A4V4H287_MUSBA|nr:hypothetical protein C4D60_Mb00t13000 [Musa balbisiana]
MSFPVVNRSSHTFSSYCHISVELSPFWFQLHFRRLIIVLAELIGLSRLKKNSAPYPFIGVGVESFLRVTLQVQFGGRRASTQPYEYSDYNSGDEESLTFDSYMIPEDDLELGQSRLLEVDNRVVVPAKTNLRMIVTPADVPHSWAVPSSGVKCDAVPGRSNHTSFLYNEKEFTMVSAVRFVELIMPLRVRPDT